MNIKQLQKMEKRFFTLYPLGFESEELQQELKKHKVQKMNDLAKSVLSTDQLLQNDEVIYDISKLISRASIVSVFEKTAFRNLIKESDSIFHQDLVDAIYTMIHDNEEVGFERLVSLLQPYKCAKWPIITALLGYYRPHHDVFVKPTTVKQVIKTFELKDIEYSSRVNHAFYTKYRRLFNEMKTHVNPKLHITNGHFSGFLMMSL